MLTITSHYTTMTGEKQYKFEEILPIYKAVSAETDTGTFADFMEAFKTFDREGQGFVAAAETRHVLQSLGMFSYNCVRFGGFISALDKVGRGCSTLPALFIQQLPALSVTSYLVCFWLCSQNILQKGLKRRCI